jgi:hypothetical protein
MWGLTQEAEDGLFLTPKYLYGIRELRLARVRPEFQTISIAWDSHETT